MIPSDSVPAQPRKLTVPSFHAVSIREREASALSDALTAWRERLNRPGRTFHGSPRRFTFVRAVSHMFHALEVQAHRDGRPVE